MKTFLSFVFFGGLLALVWYSPLHALALCAVLLVFIAGATYNEMANGTVGKSLMVMGLKAMREMEARDALSAAMQRYGFTEADLKKKNPPMAGGES